MATANGLLVCEGPARESGFCFGRRQQHRDPTESQSARLNGPLAQSYLQMLTAGPVGYSCAGVVHSTFIRAFLCVGYPPPSLCACLGWPIAIVLFRWG